jgi:DNA-directed RNA polymerase II subunit RPB2
VGKLTALKGRRSEDATPFRAFDFNDKAVQVHECGYQKYGNEIMFNPYSGKRL